MKVIKFYRNFLDFEISCYENIEYWFLLINHQHIPIQEIGLDKYNNILYKAPYKNNYGLFIDSLITIEDPEKYEQISISEFETRWRGFVIRDH